MFRVSGLGFLDVLSLGQGLGLWVVVLRASGSKFRVYSFFFFFGGGGASGALHVKGPCTRDLAFENSQVEPGVSKASPTPAPASPQKQRMPWEAEPGVAKSVPTAAARWHFGKLFPYGPTKRCLLLNLVRRRAVHKPENCKPGTG